MNEEFAPIAAAGSSKSASKRSSRLVKAGAMLAVSAGMLGAIGGVASAVPNDTSTGQTTGNAVVESGITLTALTSSFTLTGTPGATVQSAAPVTYNVETNNVAGYAVFVEADTATMKGALPLNADVINVGDLTVRETGIGSYQALTTGSGPGELIHSQSIRSENQGDVNSSEYKMRIPNVNADTYSTTLTYTATTAL